jgi:nucleotidyltransferase substrate binding protein (TIGR01987 family)
MNKFEISLNDYNKAVEQLDEALNRKTDDELIQAGCIQYFEFTFELAWKTLKFAIVDEGLPDCYSPRSCLKQAFIIGWIENEEVWLAMLESRNHMSHICNAKSALDIYHKLSDYLPEFKTLSSRLKELNEAIHLKPN